MTPIGHTLTFAAEDTLEEVIRRADDPGPGVNIYKTLSADSYESAISAPCIAITCATSRRTFPELRRGDAAYGNRTLTVAVRVRTQVDEDTTSPGVVKAARDAHRDLLGRVLDVLFRDDLLTRSADGSEVDGLLIDAGEQFGIAFNYVDLSDAVNTRPVNKGIESEISLELHAYGRV
jgi:hypothetical protein